MSVTVKLTRSEDGRFTIDMGSAALPNITWNPQDLDPEVGKQEHIGARFLLAAALSCYVSTMAGDMQKGGAKNIGEITASGEIEKERGSNLRTRFTHMEIQVETPVSPEDQEVFQLVRGSLLNGSLVTYSLEEEMDVDYNIEAI